MFKRILCLVLVWWPLAAMAQPQLVHPDPTTGWPLLVKGIDGHMEIPILVYSGNNVDLFITPSALNASLYFRSGFYTVNLYSFYKNGYQCKSTGLFAGTEALKLPQFRQDCELLGYKMRVYVVDTNARKFRIVLYELIDTDGILDLKSIHQEPEVWKNFDEFESGNHWTAEPGTKTAFAKITAMVQKKRQQFLSKYGMTPAEVEQQNRQVERRMLDEMPTRRNGCPGVRPEQYSNWHSTGCPPANMPCTPKGSGWFPEGGWQCNSDLSRIPSTSQKPTDAMEEKMGAARKLHDLWDELIQEALLKMPVEVLQKTRAKIDEIAKQYPDLEEKELRKQQESISGPEYAAAEAAKRAAARTKEAQVTTTPK